MKIEFADTAKVEALAQIANTFMEEIFDLEAGDYVISDESNLREFTDFGISDTLPVWRRIKLVYGIDQGDVASERLVDIFLAIEKLQHYQ